MKIKEYSQEKETNEFPKQELYINPMPTSYRTKYLRCLIESEDF